MAHDVQAESPKSSAAGGRRSNAIARFAAALLVFAVAISVVGAAFGLAAGIAHQTYRWVLR